MSERKVLNKYYPPDFDPSKIPKCKVPRNKTFVIRLMAPCNMRCTTCGEYIYKGRKFNARKEDVDDMTYLGLRIYRFYIKCTACVSEICFRTDPENTDYVLESGATRNFEALKRAEEQAEREDNAHKKELEDNPMKMLEERTSASKNEMELAEALDEIREINKRTVAVDYEGMLQKYDDIRARELDEMEKADENFVKAIFSKEGNVKVKRLMDEGTSSSESESEAADKAKKLKVEKPTDFLTSGITPKPTGEKKVWEKSIGTLGSSSASKKNGLGILVKKKSTATAPPLAANKSMESTFKAPNPVLAKPAVVKKPVISSTNNIIGVNVGTSSSKSTPLPAKPTVPLNPTGSLGGLLGDYSDSGSASDE